MIYEEEYEDERGTPIDGPRPIPKPGRIHVPPPLDPPTTVPRDINTADDVIDQVISHPDYRAEQHAATAQFINMLIDRGLSTIRRSKGWAVISREERQELLDYLAHSALTHISNSDTT